MSVLPLVILLYMEHSVLSLTTIADTESDMLRAKD